MAQALPPTARLVSQNHLLIDPDGRRVLQDWWLIETYSIPRYEPVGSLQIRPTKGFDVTGRPLCQDYQTYQPQRRLMERWVYIDYHATKKGWTTRGKVVFGISAAVLGLGALLITGGAVAPLVPAVATALPVVPGVVGLAGAATAMGATTGAAGGAADYVRGAEIRRFENNIPQADWLNWDPAYEQSMGDPHPCP